VLITGPMLANIAMRSSEQHPAKIAVRASMFIRARQPRLKTA
jgi:hypothetical protein